MLSYWSSLKFTDPVNEACTDVLIHMQKQSYQFRFDCECLPNMLTVYVGLSCRLCFSLLHD